MNWIEKNILHPSRGLYYLAFASFLILLTALGGRGVWTQEHRWLEIVDTMRVSGDYFHPRLGGLPYYDKPLLSYWLMAGFAKLFGQLNLWALRLPSALSGLLALFAFYQLAKKILLPESALLAAWLLLTCVYFVFWGRTASADMLNLSGMLCALSWYIHHRSQSNFFSYLIFFLIVAFTALCKGLSGPVIVFMSVFLDMLFQKTLRLHLLNINIWLAFVFGLFAFLLPFLLSEYFQTSDYQAHGLYLVYRENILRYVQPFDHQGPIWTYLAFLPIYILPWAPWFFMAIIQAGRRYFDFSLEIKWAWCVLILGFLFFTLSGSRRNYYVLPLVPFAILVTVNYLQSHSLKSKRFIFALAILVAILLWMTFGIIQPIYYMGVI